LKTEKPKAKIMEAHGGVLFIDEAYRLISSAGFGCEATGELTAMIEECDPIMILWDTLDN